jgi:hypothetical protein
MTLIGLNYGIAKSQRIKSPPRDGRRCGLTYLVARSSKHYGATQKGSIVPKLMNRVGPCGIELQTSTESPRGHQVLTITYKAVGDCQVHDNTPCLDTSRVGLRVEMREKCWATAPPSASCSTASCTTPARVSSVWVITEVPPIFSLLFRPQKNCSRFQFVRATSKFSGISGLASQTVHLSEHVGINYWRLFTSAGISAKRSKR